MARRQNVKFLRVRQLLLFPLRVVWTILRPFSRPFRPIGRPIAKYLRGVRQEFKRVSWPTRRETWRLTMSVVVFSVVFSAFIAFADYGLGVLFEKVIIKG